MKKILIVLLLALFSNGVSSQVIINIQIPHYAVHLNSQLWNMTLINGGLSASEIRIDMLLSTAQGGDPVLSGSSKEFILPVGAKQIRMADIMPVQYNILNAQYGASLNPEGFLPIGNFLVCFSIFKRSGEIFEKIAEECETIIIEPASPPLLIYPEDNSVIDENRPVFTWVPPSPVFLFSNLGFQLLLVEVLEGQQPGDALQNNLPILTQDDIIYPFLAYPTASPVLDTGKLYAWMIKAYNNAQPVSNSDIATFRLPTAKDSARAVQSIYTVLKTAEEIKYAVAKTVLYYEFVNLNNTDSLALELFDITDASTKKMALPTPVIKVFPGQNFLQMQLTNIQGLTKGHTYQLLAKEKKGPQLTLKFIYQSAE